MTHEEETDKYLEEDLMETLIEKQEIEETKEYEIAEMEKEMFESPEYWLYNAINELNKADNMLFHSGNTKTKAVVKEALFNAKEALKRITNDSKTNER